MVRTYRVPKWPRRALAAFSVFWFGGMLYSAAFAAPTPQSRADYLLVAAMVIVGLLPLLYLRAVYEVTLMDDGTCEFRSAVRRARVRAQQIAWMKFDEDAIHVRHPGGKLHVWVGEDFDDLVRRLLAFNPTIELRGLSDDNLAELRG